MRVNLNAKVKAAPNPHGIEILRKYYPGHEPRLDDEGRWEGPLWEFMAIFGPHMQPGAETPVAIKIDLDTKDKFLVESPPPEPSNPFADGISTIVSPDDVLFSIRPILAAGGRIIIEPATEARP